MAEADAPETSGHSHYA